jgi:hypothetical protein
MREMPLADLTATVVLSAVPWRSIRSHREQQHLPGLYLVGDDRRACGLRESA